MARIAGVDIPNKHIGIALTYIYGIGRSAARKICEEAKIADSVLVRMRAHAKVKRRLLLTRRKRKAEEINGYS